MDRRRRKLSFSYALTVKQFEVRLRNENVNRQDLEIVRQAADGTRYYFTTGFKRAFSYTFDYTNKELYDIFQNAFEAFQAGLDITFTREKDDGVFESIPVIILRPVFLDETIGDRKFYRDVSCEVLEI